MMRVCLVAFVLAACSDDRVVDAKVALRYHPPAGAAYRYVLEQRNTLTMEAGPLAGMGEQKVEMRMHFTQAVTGPVPGGVEVRVTFDSTHMDVPGMPAEMLAVELERLRGVVSTVLLDERAHVLTNDFGTASAVSPALASQLAAGVKAMAFPLPEQPMGRGDSWAVATDLPLPQLPGATGAGAGAARTTLTVQEIRVARGDTTVLLRVETTFPSDPVRMTVGGQPATLRLSGALSGDQLFSLTRGAVVRGTMKGKMRVNVTGGLFGRQGMVLSSDNETTMRLAGAPAGP